MMGKLKERTIEQAMRSQRKLTEDQLMALAFIMADAVTFVIEQRRVFRRTALGTPSTQVEQVVCYYGPFDIEITERLNRMRKRGLIERQPIKSEPHPQVKQWSITPIGKAVLAREQARLT